MSAHLFFDISSKYKPGLHKLGRSQFLVFKWSVDYWMVLILISRRFIRQIARLTWNNKEESRVKKKLNFEPTILPEGVEPTRSTVTYLTADRSVNLLEIPILAHFSAFNHAFLGLFTVDSYYFVKQIRDWMFEASLSCPLVCIKDLEKVIQMRNVSKVVNFPSD